MKTSRTISSCLWAAGFVVSTSAAAQIVNMQAALSGDIPNGPGAQVELRQEKHSGNTNTEAFSAQGTATYKRPEDLWLLMLKRDYSTDTGNTSADSHFAHLRYRYLFTEDWGWEAFVQEDADAFRRNERRRLYGTGPRYQMTPFENFSAAVSVAYMHEDEKFSHLADQPREPDRRNERLASNLYLAYQFAEYGTLANTLFYQPKIGDARNRKVSNESALQLAINKHLSYKLSNVYALNTRPPSGVQRTDRSFLQSLVLKW